MIRPTKKLIEFIKTFESQVKLAEHLGISDETLSRLANKNYPAGAKIIEAFYKFNHWPINEAWEVTDE